MCDLIQEGTYVVDNSPEYKDTLDIKIDYFSEDEYEEHMKSQDTFHSEKTELKSLKVTKDATQLEQPKQNEISNSLKERVANRVGKAFDRILLKERAGFSYNGGLNSTSREEVLEFIKVLTNGVKPLKVEISTPVSPEITPKRKRGRPRKYPIKEAKSKKRVYNRQNKSRF
mmetsp:Transcript_25075/g.27816  ORF Transcript_25075/g.27816 Transcript_25075/m.27816 type:complete len:171 (+) Transcript_25075:21-533(+)